MRQQLANISADNEQLLTTYHEERAKITRLEDLNQKLKKANEVTKHFRVTVLCISVGTKG